MRVTEAEQKIMQLLWKYGCLSTMQLTEKLQDDTGWSKQAVISFLKRMEAKQLVIHEERGRSKFYKPLVAKEQIAKEERTTFLQNFYHGKPGLMLSAMAEEDSLTKEDIEDLRELLKNLPDSKDM